jgi:hypothetical protein
MRWCRAASGEPPALRQAGEVELPTAGEQETAGLRTEARPNEGHVGVCQHSWGLHPQEAGVKASSRVAQWCCWGRGSVVLRRATRLTQQHELI